MKKKQKKMKNNIKKLDMRINCDVIKLAQTPQL